ncbi:MAG: phosphatase PAP2 family protein [Candidatus Moraniibacteriota bacterium]|nr:MAG: phosphatase PAP2 family protein [Candidatus Moranbacteria bacterium]
MRNFFDQMFKNVWNIFSGYNLPWHFLAIILTYILVVFGFDWKIFTHVVTTFWRGYFYIALVLGTIAPFLFPLILILMGVFLKKVKILTVGLAVLQAAILGSIISSFYKVFTGRVQPPAHIHNSLIDIGNLVDNSNQFLFGFFRHGIFWGWPSSHTTIAFAMGIAIFVLFPKNRIIRFLAPIYAFYIGIAVFVTSIHWFSEFVAGAIIGSVIGITVGKSYLIGMRAKIN